MNGGVAIGSIHSGRDTNITVVQGGWQESAKNEAADLPERDRVAVERLVDMLGREVDGEQRPRKLSLIFEAIQGIAPSVAQIIAAAIPYLAGG